MQSVQSIETRMPIRDRLSTRLLLLFAASFLAALVVIGAWTFFSTIGESGAAEAAASVQTPAIVIDPKLQTDLAKALAFEAVPAVTQVQNPFVDRANLGGSAAAATVTATRSNASAGGNNAGSAQVPSRSSGRAGEVWGGGGGGISQPPGSGFQSGSVEVDNTKSRYEDWIERQRRGEFVVPESEVLGVEDLVPVGYASGGNRGPEVILLSLSLCRTFSFPAGTRLHDGVLNGFDQREVVFIFQNGVRRKSYATQEPCRQQDPRAGGTSTN